MTILDSLPKGARVAVVRLRSLGDAVLTTPAVALLYTARPDLEIALVVEEQYGCIFEHNPHVAQILGPENLAVRRWRPKLILNLHGGTRSQWMVALSGARWRAGFAHHRVTAAYNIRIPRAQRILGVQRPVHTAEHLASAMFALGVPLGDIPPARLYADPSPVAGRYAVLHPFASEVTKQWPAQRFCELARYLTLWNIRPVFLAAQGEDVSPFSAFLTVQGSLAEAKRVVGGASLFIGNDSGPAHMAAAFAVPSLVIFGSSNPVTWGPWRTESEVIVAPQGIEHVPVARVITALERLAKFEEAHA